MAGPPESLTSNNPLNGSTGAAGAPRGQKRARDKDRNSPAPASAHAQQFAAPRRINSVVYGGYEIQALFPSPYPLEDPPANGAPVAGGSGEKKAPIPARSAGIQGAQPDKTKLEVPQVAGSTSSARSISPEIGTNGVTVPITATGGAAENGTGGVVDETDTEGDSPMQGILQEDSETSVVSTASAMSANAVAESLLPPTFRQQHPLSIAHQPPSSSPSREERVEPDEIPPTPSTSDSNLPSPILAHAPPPPTLPLPTSPSTATLPPTIASPPSPNARGRGGRFLPKPESETVKGKRKLAKAMRDAELAANPNSAPPTMTVRQQRELNKKMKGEGDKAALAEAANSRVTNRLFVCDGCFKYTVHEAALKGHSKECEFKSPPGKKVYQRGAHIIWEVDGADAKLWCQNLCLFAKLFIEHKYIFFDIEGFLFYVLTDATPSRDWILGYFSKEKVSYDDYNLACIVTFPPYQKKRYGTLLIEFSYELSRRRSETIGTPERPLSLAGQRSYLTYWTSSIVRYFRAVFEVRGEPPPIDLINWSSAPNAEEEAQALERKKKNRRSAGFEGEPPVGLTSPTAFSFRKLSASPTHHQSPSLSITLGSGTMKKTRSKDRDENKFEFPTTLEDIAEATNIRPDDVAFALVESGLAQWRRKVILPKVEAVEDTGEEEVPERELDEIVITRELVEEVADKKKVLPKLMLEMACVQL